jgi:uncharacterized protein with FMN-binding domain
MSKLKSVFIKIMKAIFCVLLVILLIIVGFSVFLLTGKEKTIGIELNGINLDSVADGTYVGSYNGYRWSNTVEVTVKNHQIINISVKKPQVFAKEETIQELTESVVSKQTTEVDVVTGATADSKAFLKAVENALD